MHHLGMVEGQLGRDAAPVEWPATWARRTPRWSSSAAASAACVAMLTGGGVWVLPTQPRLWYRISW